MKWGSRRALPGSLLGSEIVRVLVGPEKRGFELHKRLLCATSDYFRERLETSPAGPEAAVGTGHHGSGEDSNGNVLWLPAESPDMFDMFVLWLYQRRAFKSFIDAAISSATPNTALLVFPNLRKESCRRSLYWSLAHLHLFAAMVQLPVLQDVAMDALQDLYLRCDWEVPPSFVRFLYADCDPTHSFRLRKWTVAMVAWAMHGGETGLSMVSQFQALFQAHPVLWQDYVKHLEKMAESRADIRVKNPQLRLPQNRLRSEERFLGFRTCSFHSHRSVVGEGPCPLAVARIPATRSPWMRVREEMETDDSESSDYSILSPVSQPRWGMCEEDSP